MDPVLEGVLDGIQEIAEKVQTNPTQGDVTPVVEAAADGTKMEFLGSYSGTNVNSEVIFSAEGRNLTQKQPMTPEYARKLAEVAKFYGLLSRGQVGMMQLRENMMSSEFTALLGDTLDRVLLARYGVYQPTYRRFLRGRSARDFRTISSVRRNGGKRLTATPEGANYEQAAFTEEDYSYAVAKYGMTYKLTWEMFVNDDLESFTSLPEDMAMDAIQTEMYLTSSLYVANSTLFATNHSAGGSTYSNKGTAALALSSLKTAWNAMLKFPGSINGTEKTPLMNSPVFLVIPPALELTACEILYGSQVTYGGATSGVPATTHNPLEGRLEIIIDPYIPIVDATNGHTSWYLFANPQMIHGAEYAFLRGYEQPQIFMQQGNSVRLGGGNGRADGSFDNDTTAYKVRHVFGGSHANSAGGWRGCYHSDGTT